MISLTSDEISKLKLIDTLFSVLPTNILKEMAEKEDIVSVLKGVNNQAPGIIMRLVEDNTRMHTNIDFLKTRVNEQHDDLKRLVEILSANPYTSSTTYPSPAHEFQNLKSTLQYRPRLY